VAEAQQSLAGILVVDRQPPGARLHAQLVEQAVHRLRLQEASLDVQDHVVAIRLVESDRRCVTAAAHDRELHLVPVAIHIGRGEDRPKLEGPEPADARETVAHLLFFERQLRGIGEVLKPAATAAAEVGARGVDPVRRGAHERLDHRASEAGTGLDDLHQYAVPWHRAAHEEDVALDPPDAFTAEGEVIDRQFERLAAPRLPADV